MLFSRLDPFEKKRFQLGFLLDFVLGLAIYRMNMICNLISELSFMKYVMAEVFSGKLMELEEDKYTERREKVYTFMKIPREFEKVFGRCLCLFIDGPFL